MHSHPTHIKKRNTNSAWLYLYIMHLSVRWSSGYFGVWHKHVFCKMLNIGLSLVSCCGCFFQSDTSILCYLCNVVSNFVFVSPRMFSIHSHWVIFSSPCGCWAASCCQITFIGSMASGSNYNEWTSCWVALCMGQVTKVRLSCYLVLLSTDSKTR